MQTASFLLLCAQEENGLRRIFMQNSAAGFSLFMVKFPYNLKNLWHKMTLELRTFQQN